MKRGYFKDSVWGFRQFSRRHSYSFDVQLILLKSPQQVINDSYWLTLLLGTCSKPSRSSLITESFACDLCCYSMSLSATSWNFAFFQDFANSLSFRFSLNCCPNIDSHSSWVTCVNLIPSMLIYALPLAFSHLQRFGYRMPRYQGILWFSVTGVMNSGQGLR